MKVFMGSSTESLSELREIASWIEREEEVTVLPWNKPELFLPGQNTYQRLLQIANEVQAAIFVFGEDDEAWYHSDSVKQPRDNVLLEYGLFSGRVGSLNTVICRKPGVKTPSDLQGLVVVNISENKKNFAQQQLTAWIRERQQASKGGPLPYQIRKGRVVLLTKATTGYTGELSACIQKEFRGNLPELTLEVVTPALEEAIQPGDFLDALNKQPEVVIVTPSFNNGPLIPTALQTLKRGIPIITVDDQLDSKPFIEHGFLPPVNIACDYADGGKKAANVIMKQLRYKGNVAVISGPVTSFSSQIRKFAFIDKILSASPNMSIVSVKETNWNPQAGKIKMREILDETDGLDALFCCNDRLALKAIEAIKESGRFKTRPPIVVGHDGIREAYDALRNGDLFATINQHMDQLAKITIDELRHVLVDKESYLQKHNLVKSLLTDVITHDDVVASEGARAGG